MKRALLTLTAAAGLYAQSSVPKDGIQGPMVGWISDPADGSLRSVMGIPGASLLGERLNTGAAYAKAAIAGGNAVALAAEGGQPSVVDLRTGSVRALDAPAGASQVFLSPNGNAAALLYPDSQKLARVTSLAGSPSVTTFDIAAEGLPASVAISDDALSILALYPDRILAFDGEGNRWKLNLEASARSITFLDGSHDALVATGDGVWLVSDTAGNANVKQIWAGGAVSAAVTANRRHAVAIDDNGALVALNLETGVSKSVECACQPAALVRMSDSIFRVNDLSNGPLWLVDLNGLEPRTVFVPADVKSEQ